MKLDDSYETYLEQLLPLLEGQICDTAGVIWRGIDIALEGG
jgi:hypothetical protein